MSQLMELDAAGNVIHAVDYFVTADDQVVDFEQWESQGRDFRELLPATANRLKAWPGRVPNPLAYRAILNTNGRILQLEDRVTKVRIDR